MRFSPLVAMIAMLHLAAAAKVRMTGYLMDNRCIELCVTADPALPCTPDGAHAFYTPQIHTGFCLLLPVCVNSGYSLMSEFPTEPDGRHAVLLNLAGNTSQVSNSFEFR
jgi:hypothetical protein